MHLPPELDGGATARKVSVDDLVAEGPLIYLQPIVDVASGQIVAAEALARFPSLLDLTVDEVFASVRSAGRGFDLEAACVRAARSRLPALPNGVRLAINVSPDALGSPGVQAALAGDLDGLIIEVTEHPASDLSQLADHLDELRRHGARVAVDDVSTGYAGLLRLAGLRPHILKIDRSAVTAVTGSTERVAVIEALVSMGRRLGCLLLAEGVESEEDLAALSALDVDLVQGWAIAPPAAGLEPISPAIVAACLDARRELLWVTRAEPWAGAGGDVDIHHVTAALARASRKVQLDRALVVAAETLGASLIGVSLLGADGGLREIVATGAPIDPAVYYLADYPATAHALNDAVMLEVHADRSDSDPAEQCVLHRYKMASLLLVPLLLDDVPVGILELNRTQPHRWTVRDISHARSLAEHVTHALLRLDADPAVAAREAGTGIDIGGQ